MARCVSVQCSRGRTSVLAAALMAGLCTVKWTEDGEVEQVWPSFRGEISEANCPVNLFGKAGSMMQMWQTLVDCRGFSGEEHEGPAGDGEYRSIVLSNNEVVDGIELWEVEYMRWRMIEEGVIDGLAAQKVRPEPSLSWSEETRALLALRALRLGLNLRRGRPNDDEDFSLYFFLACDDHNPVIEKEQAMVQTLTGGKETPSTNTMLPADEVLSLMNLLGDSALTPPDLGTAPVSSGKAEIGPARFDS